MTNAKELTARLGGDWHGTYGLAPGPGHSSGDRSLRIWDYGGQPYFHSFAGQDWRDIRDTLADMGLLRGQTPDRNQHHVKEQHVIPQKITFDQRAEFAQRVWASGDPIHGTLAETYLRARRLIGPFPSTLRYVSQLKHLPSGQVFPALVSAVQMTGQDHEIPYAIHRTYLDPDGRGKAKVTPNKMMLGPCKGGAVRFGDGLPSVHRLILAEGIETALTLRQGTGFATWACLSSSGLMAVNLPKTAKDIVVGADHDPPGRTAANTLAARLTYEGRSVKIIYPEAAGADFNDELFEV